MSACLPAARFLARSRWSGFIPSRTTTLTHSSRGAFIVLKRELHATPDLNNATATDHPIRHELSSEQSRAHGSSGSKRFVDFDLAGKVCIVTGGAQGLGLAMAERLSEAGCKVYCLDRNPRPGASYDEAQLRLRSDHNGELRYRQVEITDTERLNNTIQAIGDENKRLDGLICAAAIQQVTPAAEYSVCDARKMMDVNYTGVLMSCTAAAREMFKYKCRGSICIVASMSGVIANKGLLSPVYNSSKAACIQLARNLAMEWTPIKEDGTGGIRVNCMSPGHIITPMVAENIRDKPELVEEWTRENMMGRLATTGEFKGAALFLMSGASSFMTGSNLIIDGGHTAW